MFTVNGLAVGNGMWYSINIIFYFILISINALNMFTEYEFKLEILVAISRSYSM